MENRFELIRQWAEEKGIYDKGDLKTQTLKLIEEAGELAKAVLNEDLEEIEDAIGDCVVVLTNVAELANKHFGCELTLESCVDSAYNVIAKRKGRMENGTFIKES